MATKTKENGRNNGTLALSSDRRTAASVLPKKLKRFGASVHFSAVDAARIRDGVPAEFVELIRQLETELSMPVWLLIQNGRSKQFSQIDRPTFKGFQQVKSEIPDGEPVALLIESPGGLPDEAFHIARLFQRRGKPFTILVPQYAKSAATLLALAGHDLIMGRDAELGPLDVQVFEETRERMGSALNTLQALERLHADSMRIVDEMMQLLVLRTGKKVEALLPAVLCHGTDFVKPLVEKIDTLDYTEKSRAMKMAEDYAIELMSCAGYHTEEAEQIAHELVTSFSDHGFIIDAASARKIVRFPGKSPHGLAIQDAPVAVEKIFDNLLPFLDDFTIIGRLQEREQ